MEIKILFILIILLGFSAGTVFAQESLISVQTDDNNYDEGDTIVISGNVSTMIGDTPVLIQIVHEGAFIEIRQLDVAKDGTFSQTIIAEGNVWKSSGEYLIRAFYQEYIAESSFTYTSKVEVKETKENFEVDAGSHGTFDIEYTIKGATIKDMVVDSDIFALIVQLDAIDEGSITLNLPREFIGAEKQDGKDDTFIILIDGIEVAYQEAVVLSESRKITINFEQGDSDIEIIGTYVVPEFGSIVMLMLIAGIITTILATRNRFQIKV